MLRYRYRILFCYDIVFCKMPPCWVTSMVSPPTFRFDNFLQYNMIPRHHQTGTPHTSFIVQSTPQTWGFTLGSQGLCLLPGHYPTQKMIIGKSNFHVNLERSIPSTSFLSKGRAGMYQGYIVSGYGDEAYVVSGMGTRMLALGRPHPHALKQCNPSCDQGFPNIAN